MSSQTRLSIVVALAFAAPAFAQVDASGKQIVDATCNSCHALNARTGNGYTPEGWRSVLDMMTNHGVNIPAESRPAMFDYLVNNFPEKNKAEPKLIPGPVKVSMQSWSAPTPGSRPHDPMAARDGSLWYSGQMANVLGRVDPKTRTIREYPLKTANSGPHGLVED